MTFSPLGNPLWIVAGKYTRLPSMSNNQICSAIKYCITKQKKLAYLPHLLKELEHRNLIHKFPEFYI